MDPVLGELIDNRYRVESVLGAGGTSAVYRAKQEGVERAVVLKIMRLDLSRDAKAKERFLREGKIASSLHHKNIVECYSLGLLHDRVPYLAYEFVEGLSLRDLLVRERVLDVKLSLVILSQICAGLQHAHDQNLVHRDIKPENIMISLGDETVSVKLIDFGLGIKTAATIDGNKLTQTGMVVGTVMYMSPEQCKSNGADARSDIYSVGCVMYEMLTGRTPFSADTPHAVMFSHMTLEPEQIERESEFNMTWLNAIVAKAMHKDPARRYQRASELREDIERVLTGEAPLRLSGVVRATWTPPRSSAKWVFALFGCFVAVSVLLAIGNQESVLLGTRVLLLFPSEFAISLLGSAADYYERKHVPFAAITCVQAALSQEVRFTPESARLRSRLIGLLDRVGDEENATQLCLQTWQHFFMLPHTKPGMLKPYCQPLERLAIASAGVAHSIRPERLRLFPRVSSFADFQDDPAVTVAVRDLEDKILLLHQGKTHEYREGLATAYYEGASLLDDKRAFEAVLRAERVVDRTRPINMLWHSSHMCYWGGKIGAVKLVTTAARTTNLFDPTIRCDREHGNRAFYLAGIAVGLTKIHDYVDLQNILGASKKFAAEYPQYSAGFSEVQHAIEAVLLIEKGQYRGAIEHVRACRKGLSAPCWKTNWAFKNNVGEILQSNYEKIPETDRLHQLRKGLIE